MDLRTIRTELDAWVSTAFPGSSYADGGGQRLVYRIPERGAALKVWATDDPAQHERHVREVSALSRLHHRSLPRVVAPVAQIEVAGELLAFYLEEWVDSPSIKAQLQTLPMNADRVRAFGTDVADAVAALHAQGIVHRDVSLGNVLANETRGHLIDLGLAKHLDLDSLTRIGERLPRTELTASPEQLQGASADLRAPTDIYSLGVVLNIASTGRHPYIDDGEQLELGTLIHRQLSGDMRNIPGGSIGQLITRMLDPVIMFRPTATAVAESLS